MVFESTFAMDGSLSVSARDAACRCSWIVTRRKKRGTQIMYGTMLVDIEVQRTCKNMMINTIETLEEGSVPSGRGSASVGIGIKVTRTECNRLERNSMTPVLGVERGCDTSWSKASGTPWKEKQMSSLRGCEKGKTMAEDDYWSSVNHGRMQV